MRNYQWITFDCYGTLIDWETGISTAFEKAFTACGVPFERKKVLELYHRIEAEEERSYKMYRQILKNVAKRICDEVGVPLASFDFLPESVPAWPPFADTNAALQRLAAPFRLGILSNVDRDLIAATQRHFAVPFDLVITAQDVGSYKPGHGHFQRARTHIGGAGWLHAAQSYFHDLVPCHQLGIDSAWVNRGNEAPADKNVSPLFNGASLAAFADWILKK